MDPLSNEVNGQKKGALGNTILLLLLLMDSGAARCAFEGITSVIIQASRSVGPWASTFV